MYHKYFILLFAFAHTTLSGTTDNGLGVSSWASWKPKQVSRTSCPELRSVPLIIKWDTLEIIPGVYLFDEKIGSSIKSALEDNLYVTIKLYVGPACPEWIYEKGVPVVMTDRVENALGVKTQDQSKYPYYLHPEYKKRFSSLIHEFGKWVHGLAPELRERIIFVQCAEGSTGDGQPYKGRPIDKKYLISHDEWNEFRREAWQNYQKAIPNIPIIVNSDANSPKEIDWMLKNMDNIGMKMGMFSHGYQVSENDQRLNVLQYIEAEAKKLGKKVITRGEMDGELFVSGWAKRNVPQALYWSGIFASHCRLDVWNIPYKALLDEANRPTLRFFNKYAGHKEPSTAPAAFCALRDGLDASDYSRFPADIYGGNIGNKHVVNRYINIANKFASYGAKMADPEKATGGGMINRKASGPNDVGWCMVPGNYSRFLTQIDPGSGDVGRWNIDETIYGRFARAFEHKSAKTEMRFLLDPLFGAKKLKISIHYLDQGNGSWALKTLEQGILLQIKNENSGQWKTASVSANSFAELKLQYVSDDDTVFHMIEVERASADS